jgi:hypothetical protein
MNSFMQNKPNLLDTQMSVTSAHITSYQLPVTNYQYAKQTQSNPIFAYRLAPNFMLGVLFYDLEYTIGLYEKVFTE